MENATSNKVSTVVVGVLGIAVGLFAFLAMSGVLPQATHHSADPTPSWMGWLIGAMFFGAGSITIARGIWGGESDSSGSLSTNAPYPVRVIQNIVGAGIACSLAALFTWVGFGPGPRHFSMWIGIPFVRTAMSGNAFAGRVAFGTGAVIMWCVIAALAVNAVRNSRK